jgi:hypothetical protein
LFVVHKAKRDTQNFRHDVSKKLIRRGKSPTTQGHDGGEDGLITPVLTDKIDQGWIQGGID